MGQFQNRLASNNTDSSDHYPFMAGTAQSHERSLPQFCPGVCRTHHWVQAFKQASAQTAKCNNTINAFLTLLAVTEW
jgi:hypothetical protein